MAIIDITIIICTYNRGQELGRTLASIGELIIPEGLRWEVVVVDNNSADATRQVCLEHQLKLPLRYHFESRQGKSFALNTGVQIAEGEFLVFTDDDVRVDPRWLAALWGTYQRFPGKFFFGGRVLPLWEKPPPRWVIQNLKTLTVLFPYLDWGNQEKKADVHAGELFVGGNSAYPRSAFSGSNGFTEEVGLLAADAQKGYRVGLEDTEFGSKLNKNGWQGIYVPDAVVRHLNLAERFSETQLRKFYMGSGMATMRMERTLRLSPSIWGVPRYLWRKFVTAMVRFFLTRWTCSSRIWVPAECQMALIWGMIVECRAKHKP